MVMPYRATEEDRTLTSPYRMYKGRKIDIRWSGGWLTPEGVYYPVDYKEGVTHETIAEEHGRRICGSGSIMTRPPIMRIFDIAEWMRITYLENSTFCVELKGSFVSSSYYSNDSEEERRIYQHRRQNALLDFVKDYKDFESYFINNSEYKSYREFVVAIRNNEVDPVARDM